MGIGGAEERGLGIVTAEVALDMIAVWLGRLNSIAAYGLSW